MTYMHLLFFVQIILILAPKSGAKVPAIIFFGDSCLDTGNNNYITTIMRSNFKPYGRDFPGGMSTGRFSDGRLLSDFISESAGLKPMVPAYLDPANNISDLATGVSFASSGTGYVNSTSDVFQVIPLWKELEYYKDYQNKLKSYLGLHKANYVTTEALYTIILGTNDFIVNYYTVPGRESQFTVKQFQDLLIGSAENFFKQLYHRGARKILLGGIPPIGCLPLIRTKTFQSSHQCNEEYNKVSVEFNGRLKNLVTKLNKELPGVRVVYADVYSTALEMIKYPSNFGFEVADLGCCGTGRFETALLCNDHMPFTCTDATKYVFWDSVHPTEKANKIVSDHLKKYLKLFL